MEPRSRPRQFRVQGASWSHSSDLRFGWYGTASINPRVHMTILGCLSDLSIWSIKNIFIQMSRLILTTALWDVGEGGGSSSKGDFAAFQKYSSQLRWGSSAELQVTPKSKYSKSFEEELLDGLCGSFDGRFITTW